MPAIKYSRRFKREFRGKSAAMQRAILETLAKLEAGPPYPRGLRLKPMQGYRGVMEASVDMGTRVTFEKEDDVILLRANCNHDVLRRP